MSSSHVLASDPVAAEHQTSLNIDPLSDIFGAEISGVDLGQPLAKHTISDIKTAFRDHQLLLFRDQDVPRAAQVRFTGYFGQLEMPINRDYWGKDFPEVHTVSNLDADGKPKAAQALANPGNFFWHTDGSYLKAPPACSLLYSVEIPSSGGNTSFVSTYHAYETLELEQQEKLDNLRLVHSWAQSRINSGSRPPTEEELRKAPPIPHPLVRTHPDTDRKALYMGIHTSHIEGMDPEESRLLLDDLLHHATRPDVVYEHKWRPGDLVMWDNRCLMHFVVPDHPFEMHRRMHRTTAAGDRPFL